MAFVHGMLAGVQARGESCERFLADAGIAADLLGQAAARVTADQYASLFQALIERREDECLGFLSRPLKPGSFALIARSALDAPDLGTAIRHVAHVFRLLQDDVVLARISGEDGLTGLALSFCHAPVVQPVFVHEMLLRVFWRLLTWLAGGRLPATRFDFAFDSPPHAGSYGQVFPAQIRFGCPRSAVWFDASRLQGAVRRDKAALRAFLADAQRQIILPSRADDVASTRVRRHLQALLPAWPDLAGTARSMNMSTATLQRRLAAERTSFQSLKDELRRDIAIVRLNTSSVSLAELALELGFSDSATFQRAFKAWTGSAPGSYRREADGDDR